MWGTTIFQERGSTNDFNFYCWVLFVKTYLLN